MWNNFISRQEGKAVYLFSILAGALFIILEPIFILAFVAAFVMLLGLKREYIFLPLLLVVASLSASIYDMGFLIETDIKIIWLIWFVSLLFLSIDKPNETNVSKLGYFFTGGIFAYGALKKILSPRFLDGTTLEALFISDPRTVKLLNTFGLLTPEETKANKDIINYMETHNGALPPDASLHTVDIIHKLTPFISVSTLIFELLIAGVFLYLVSRPAASIKKWGELCLILFIVGTYFVLPVLSFGGLLIAIGFAASNLTVKSRWLLYSGLLAYMFLLAYRV